MELDEDMNQVVEDLMKQILDLNESRVLEQMFQDCRYRHLLIQTHTWEEKVVRILHVVRCREFTQRNPKTGICQPCRFSLFNIALFDFDKECEYYIYKQYIYSSIHTCNLFNILSLLWSPGIFLFS